MKNENKYSLDELINSDIFDKHHIDFLRNIPSGNYTIDAAKKLLNDILKKAVK